MVVNSLKNSGSAAADIWPVDAQGLDMSVVDSGTAQRYSNVVTKFEVLLHNANIVLKDRETYVVVVKSVSS